MAKKKAAAKKKSAQSGKRAAKKKATRKAPAKKAKTGVRKSTANKVVRKTTTTKRSAAALSTKRKRTTKKTTKITRVKKSLGRPRIPGHARLDVVFQKDYQAREVFEFLDVNTLQELEQFGPADIVEKLTSPMVQTVERIRKALALNNRCLADDREFALAFQAILAQRR